MKKLLLASAAILSFTVPVSALTPGANDVYVRVVDVGNGLCTVTKAPDNHFMIYDVGHWQSKQCAAAVRELLGQNQDIDLMVISHGDSDHHGEAAAILSEFSIKKILITYDPEQQTVTLERTLEAIGDEAEDGAEVLDLHETRVNPGTEFAIGTAKFTFLAGWPAWESDTLSESELRNAISIVGRLEYQGKSVLFTGDTVGRRKTDSVSACKDAERVVVNRRDRFPIQSEVIIAPHHGANNANSRCLIQAVDPSYVIFSAGRSYAHPTQQAAQRYRNAGVPLANIFRTDLGDDEDNTESNTHWAEGSIQGCVDKRGDDDIDIILKANGQVEVDYRDQSGGC